MGKNLEGKVSAVNVRLPHNLYERFKRKAIEEGFSLQKATYLLIEHYTNDILVIKKDKDKNE